MRIDSYNKLQATNPVNAVGGQAKTSQKTATPDPSGETVSFSSAAQELADRSAAQAETTKVAGLQAAIKDGSFKVDTQAIAKRIVEGN